MHPSDDATIQALRRDLALLIARFLERSGTTQVAAARSLGIPQPTLSKIANAQVSALSLELLIRIAVRAQLPLVLQTGKDPNEAGVFVSGTSPPARAQRSRLAERARDGLNASAQLLTPEQRLDAQLTHSELLAELQQASRYSRAEVATRRRRNPR
jgi:predicted XRE-type DNA-binding protein